MTVGIPVKVFFNPLNDTVIELDGLQDAISKAFQDDDAVVTATLYDQRGNAVPGCTDIVMSFIADSNGDYQGTFPGSAFNPTPTGGYKLIVTAAVGSVQAVWTLKADVEVRDS